MEVTGRVLKKELFGKEQSYGRYFRWCPCSTCSDALLNAVVLTNSPVSNDIDKFYLQQWMSVTLTKLVEEKFQQLSPRG